MHISNIFCQAQICMNDYFALLSISTKGYCFVFNLFFAGTTDEVYHPYFLSYRGEFLGVLSSNFVIFQSTQRSPARD